MRSDSVKNMSAYADQNHAPSLAAARLEKYYNSRSTSIYYKSTAYYNLKKEY